MAGRASNETIDEMVAGDTARGRRFRRFDIHQLVQHWMMAGSFILLMVTGWPLKMAGVGGSRVIVDLFGSLEACGTWHRIAAFVMITCCAYHVVYIGLRWRQKRLSLKIVPNLRDLREFAHNVRHFVGLEKRPPKFGRWTYYEKFDYWAVFWGVFIMVGSGLVLWFPEFFMGFLPGWVLSVSLIAHSDEALLAGLAIFIWHFYNVHLRRTVFPMNWTWLTGTMPEHQFKEEHAAEYERLVGEQAEGADDGAES